MATNPTEFFTAKAQQFEGGVADLDGLNGLYQFNLTGDDGGNWVIELSDDTREVRIGEDDNAQCVINMTTTDFMDMIGGSLSPQSAFFTGRLRVKGDMGLALRLQKILE